MAVTHFEKEDKTFACGRKSATVTSTNWDEVTCKSCIKRKEKAEVSSSTEGERIRIGSTMVTTKPTKVKEEFNWGTVEKGTTFRVLGFDKSLVDVEIEGKDHILIVIKMFTIYILIL